MRESTDFGKQAIAIFFDQIPRPTLEDLLSDMAGITEVLRRHVVVGRKVVGGLTICHNISKKFFYQISMEDVAEGPTLLPTMSGEFVTITKETTVSGEEDEEQETKIK